MTLPPWERRRPAGESLLPGQATRRRDAGAPRLAFGLMSKASHGMKARAKLAKATAAPAAVTHEKSQLNKEDAAAPKMTSELQHALPALAFFVVFYLCLWKWVDVKLIYHGGGQVKDFPSFYWGWEFARDFRTRPGGLVEYGSALLAQSLYSSWLGGLVLTVQAALAYLGIAGCLRAFGAHRLRVVGLIPPLLFLVLYSEYRHYSAPISAFTAAVVLLWAWLRLSVRIPRFRPVIALVLLACLYAAASSAVIVFVPVALLFELRSRAPALRLVLWLGLCALIPWLEGFVLFGFAPGEAFAKLLPLVWDPVVWSKQGVWIVSLYLVPPLLCLALWVGDILSKRNYRAEDCSAPARSANKAGTQGSDHPSGKQSRGPGASKPPVAWWKWQTAACTLAPLATVYLALNAQVKAFLAVDYLAWHGRWSEVTPAGKGDSRNPFVACALAQAGYHLGTLSRELPMLSSPMDLLLSGDRPGSTWKKSDLYFDLGYVNMALHYLTESVEFYGERPVLLQRLALVNLALGNLSTAKVYLGTLTRAPFQGRWARDYLEQLRSDPTLAGDQEIGRLRRFMVRRDSVLALSPDEELLQLLAANPQNRMAFEYLMTYYLLKKNLNAFVKNISRVKDFPGFAITPLWDEALVLAGRQLGRAIALPGHTISEEAQARVAAVIRLVQQYGEKGELPRSELSSENARTYSFYWCFHL